MKITEDQMILEFLQAEIESPRFKQGIIEELVKLSYSVGIISNANLNDFEENKIRKDIFKLYRDFENEDGLFEGFPGNVEWFEEEITKEDLLSKVFYIDYSYWNEITDGTRLPKDAVEKIKNNIEIYGQSNENFLQASAEFQKGKKFPKLILVSDGNKTVVLEGHLRITVYAMNRNLLPAKLPIIIGYSPEMRKWSCF